MIDNPVPDGLDGRDDPGRMRAPGQAFEVTGQGSEGVAAEVPPRATTKAKNDLRVVSGGSAVPAPIFNDLTSSNSNYKIYSQMEELR